MCVCVGGVLQSLTYVQCNYIASGLVNTRNSMKKSKRKDTFQIMYLSG